MQSTACKPRPVLIIPLHFPRCQRKPRYTRSRFPFSLLFSGLFSGSLLLMCQFQHHAGICSRNFPLRPLHQTGLGLRSMTSSIISSQTASRPMACHVALLPKSSALHVRSSSPWLRSDLHATHQAAGWRPCTWFRKKVGTGGHGGITAP